MTATTTARTSTSTARASTSTARKSDIVTDKAGFASFTGRDKAARTDALLSIAPLAYAENVSRAACIDGLRKALGKAPTDAALSAAQTEYVIGRVAARFPADAFPKSGMTPEQKLAHARDVVLFYAMPLKDGVKARALTKAHKGRRTPAQHKVIRAAAEAWSQIKAELGLSAAQTQAQRNASKARGAHPAGSTGAAGKSAPKLTPAAELIPTPANLTPADAVNHIVTQAAALLAYANKHAKLLPSDFGSAVRAFKSATDKADALYRSVNA